MRKTIRLECGKSFSVSTTATLFDFTASDREFFSAICDLLQKHDHEEITESALGTPTGEIEGTK